MANQTRNNPIIVLFASLQLIYLLNNWENSFHWRRPRDVVESSDKSLYYRWQSCCATVQKVPWWVFVCLQKGKEKAYSTRHSDTAAAGNDFDESGQKTKTTRWKMLKCENSWGELQSWWHFSVGSTVWVSLLYYTVIWFTVSFKILISAALKSQRNVVPFCCHKRTSTWHNKHEDTERPWILQLTWENHCLFIMTLSGVTA